MAPDETITFRIHSELGDENEVTIPSGLVDFLAEDGQEPAAVVGDIVLLSFASRAHHAVHHEGGDDLPEGLEADEGLAMELFEERFGISFAEAVGHEH